MNRDMELVREILLRIESMEPRGLPDLDIPGYPEEAIDYHLDLLISHGFINGQAQWSHRRTLRATINGLEWEGHDLLDAIRDESVWASAKKIAKERGQDIGSLPFQVAIDLVKSVASGELKELLHL